MWSFLRIYLIIRIATNQRTTSNALTSCIRISMNYIDPFSARGTNDIRSCTTLWCGIFLYNKTPFAIGTSRRGFAFGGSNALPILVTSILYHSQISSIAVLIKAQFQLCNHFIKAEFYKVSTNELIYFNHNINLVKLFFLILILEFLPFLYLLLLFIFL